MKDFGFRWLVILFLMGLCLPGTAQYFRQVGSYSDGMAVVQEYRPNVGRMNNYGYVNEYNKLVIPMKYGYAGDFNKGLAIVGVGIKRGLINKSGKIVLPIIYDAASFLVSSESEVVVKVTKDGKDGVAGKNGIILPCQFSGVYGGYVEGDRRKIIFAVFDLSKIKLFELSGKPILPEGTYIYKYDQVISYDYSGTDYIYNTVSFRSLKDEKIGVFDMINRKVLVPPEYESVEPVRYGNFVVKKNGLCGMFNPDGDGKFIIPMQFDHISDRIDSYGHKNLKAYKDNEFAIYDYEGNEIVPLGSVGEYYLGDAKYHLIRRNGKYGMLFVHDNQLVLDMVYDTIYKAGGGFISVNGDYGEPFIVKKNGKYGITAVIRSDRFKEAVFLSPEYDEVKFSIDSFGKKIYYLYKKDGLWGLTTSFSNSEHSLPLAFDEIEESFDYFNQIDGFVVKRDGKWGYYRVNTDYRDNMERFDTKPQLLSYNSYDKSYKLIIGCINGKYGISSLDGDVLIPFENDYIIVGAFDYCVVKKNGKWGLLQIDNSLSLIDYEQMEFIYDGIGKPSRFCPVRVKNKWGYCIDGKYAIKAQYDEAGEFINGRALVRKGKKVFYIDSKGKKVK